MTTNLTDRLDDLMIRLDQEGRERDAQLVREAAEALGKPPVAGTPWTTPLKGDKCMRTDGKSREAVKVEYTDGSWSRTSDKPAPGWWPNLVRFVDQNGREDTISASSWATWCRAACRDGGSYTRAEVGK